MEDVFTSTVEDWVKRQSAVLVGTRFEVTAIVTPSDTDKGITLEQ